MIKSKHLLNFPGRVFLIVFLVLCFQASYLNSQTLPKIKPLKPLQLWSSQVGVFSYPIESLLICNIRLRLDSNPADNYLVLLDGKTEACNVGNGVYHAVISPYAIYANRPIEFAIKPKRSLIPNEGLVKAKGQIADIIVIESPSWNELIDLATADVIRVRWRFTAGSGPVSNIIVTVDNGHGTGPVVFRQNNVTGNTLDMSKSTFIPGQSYIIEFIKNIKNFSLEGFVTSDSRIELFFGTRTRFTTR